MNDVECNRKNYRANEVKEIFNIHRTTINRWIKDGIITKYKKIGRILYLDREEIDRLSEVL